MGEPRRGHGQQRHLARGLHSYGVATGRPLSKEAVRAFKVLVGVESRGRESSSWTLLVTKSLAGQASTSANFYEC